MSTKHTTPPDNVVLALVAPLAALPQNADLPTIKAAVLHFVATLGHADALDRALAIGEAKKILKP